MTTKFKIGDRVVIDSSWTESNGGPDPDLVGSVGSVRMDDRGEAIYTVVLDEERATEYGLYVARDCELELIPIPDRGTEHPVECSICGSVMVLTESEKRFGGCFPDERVCDDCTETESGPETDKADGDPNDYDLAHKEREWL